jgi:hypothetical protein
LKRWVDWYCAWAETGVPTSKRPFGKTPVAVADGLFFRREFVLWIFLRAFGAFVTSSVAELAEQLMAE